MQLVRGLAMFLKMTAQNNKAYASTSLKVGSAKALHHEKVQITSIS